MRVVEISLQLVCFTPVQERMDSILQAGRRLLGLAPTADEARRGQGRIVDETPTASGDEESSEDESETRLSAASGNPRFCFKVETLDPEEEMKDIVGREAELGRDRYLFSVMNWDAFGHVGRRRMDQIEPASASKSATYISIGSYTVKGVMQMIENAADVAGFTVYAHHGAKMLGNRCTIRFGCDHGRKRHADRETPAFEKDLATVVGSSCRKKRTTRMNHGYDPAETARRRLKRTECGFHFSIIAYQCAVKFNPEVASKWQLSSHGNSSKDFQHTKHTLRGTRIIFTDEAKKYVLAHCARHTVQELLTNVHYTYKLDLTVSQVRYWIVKNNMTLCTVQRPQGQSRSADTLSSIVQLLRTKNSQVILLLVDVLTGEWISARASMSVNNELHLEKSSYTDKSIGTTQPLLNPDADRVIQHDGRAYFVHSSVWNYLDDIKLFAAYPQVLQMDAQANVNRSTDGFNVVGVCGNYHNIVVIRSFIGSQRAETFRWMFSVAFVYLLGAIICSGVRSIVIDGCAAVIGELQVCCAPGGLFGNAKLLRCIFHLLIDAWDRMFGYAKNDSWFLEYKQYLFRLKNCETPEEFQDCTSFVLRKAAGCECLNFPKIDVIKFVMTRVKISQDWVLFSHITVCNRACVATGRVESEHGHSRNAGVNARCSWCLSITRYEKLRTARRRRLMGWIRRQLDGNLSRGVTNASESTLTPTHLHRLDCKLLPWMLDTLEEQMLLGRVAGDVRIKCCGYGLPDDTQDCDATTLKRRPVEDMSLLCIIKTPRMM
jgi:hypothetical protein